MTDSQANRQTDNRQVDTDDRQISRSIDRQVEMIDRQICRQIDGQIEMIGKYTVGKQVDDRLVDSYRYSQADAQVGKLIGRQLADDRDEM